MIGLIVNPVAGLGGTVGLKGTDGVAKKAVQLGAVPQSGERAVKMLQNLKNVDICTCGGEMGAYAAQKAGCNYKVVYQPSSPTSFKDTVKAARIMEKKVDLLVFCGGDGTAREVCQVDTPILGIPAGVKMYSACFAVTPDSAAEITHLFLEGKIHTAYCEILDIDESLYRKGVLSVNLFGYANVPQHTTVQSSKQVISDESYQKREIAAFISELIREDTVYIVGAGTTTKAIGDILEVDKTLLGVDIVRGNRLLKKDCSENDILAVVKKEKEKEKEMKAKIIVSPIGGQGFIFGRGNQQLSPAVITTVGTENIVVVATPEKLVKTPVLHVDTGDANVDAQLKGEYVVVCGYRLATRKRVV
ncbi:MAG: ATP-NAD kinase family protein [Theionarchaea archaeon]|nr:ATP-NAD kinase family protein [Theionarchaea archaeon]